MVREISIIPDFKPGYIGVGGKIPRFRYQRTLDEELRDGGVDREQSLRLFAGMLLIRNFEQMICELKDNKGRYGPMKYLFGGASHVSIGQEAISVGANSPLKVTDCITSSHRGHGDSLAKGLFALYQMDDEALTALIQHDARMQEYLALDPAGKGRDELLEQATQLHLYRAIAELFGKEDGYCRGRGAGMHIADFSKGHLGANAIVGGSLGMAVGAGIGARALQDDTVVVCFAGDGAYNNGIAHESMNMATMAQFRNGLMKATGGVPTIFAIVNNQYGMTGQQRGEVTGIEFLAERAFGYNHDGLHAEVVNGMDVLAVFDATRRMIDVAREGNGPVLLEFWCSRYKGHSLSDTLTCTADETYRTMDELEAWRKVDPITQFAQQLVDAEVASEEDIEAMKTAARSRNEAMAVKAAEAEYPDPAHMYDGLFSTTTSAEVPKSFQKVTVHTKPAFLDRDPQEPMNYREALGEALYEELARDARVMMWGEDIADYGGAFKVTQGLLEAFGRDRVFNTAISESAIIGAGLGAALKGLRPVVEIMYIDFILQAMDQLGNQAAKWKYMSGGQPTVPLTVRTSIGGGKGYAGQHSQSLEAVVTHVPGVKVVAPATAYDAKGLLKASIREDNPVLFLEHQNLYRHPQGRSLVPKEDYLVPLGKADVKRAAQEQGQPAQATVIAWSYMVPVALRAAEQLSDAGIEVDVIDIRTLIPLDMDTIGDSVRASGRAVVVHQAVKTCGFGAEIAARIQEELFDYLDGPVIRIAAPDVPPPASSVLEKAFLPSEENVVDTVTRMCGE